MEVSTVLRCNFLLTNNTWERSRRSCLLPMGCKHAGVRLHSAIDWLTIWDKGRKKDLSEFNRALRPDSRLYGEINSKTKKKQADLQKTNSSVTRKCLEDAAAVRHSTIGNCILQLPFLLDALIVRLPRHITGKFGGYPDELGVRKWQKWVEME